MRLLRPIGGIPFEGIQLERGTGLKPDGASAAAVGKLTEDGITYGTQKPEDGTSQDPATTDEIVCPELHVKALGYFKHKGNKKTLWVDSLRTPQLVTEAQRRRTTSTNYSRSNIEYVTGITADGELSQRDECLWTAEISQHVKRGQSKQALDIYEEMRQCGVKPSSYTFVAALKACSCLQDLGSAKHIHADVVESGFESDIYVGNMLVNVYAKCGSLVEARRVFEKMPHRDVVSWNAMISGYTRMGQGEEALQLYARMQQEGGGPNQRTFVGALKACSILAPANKGDITIVDARCLDVVRSIHSLVMKTGAADVFVGNTLVDVYCKHGSLVDARHVFDNMPHRNVVSWTAMIWGYAQGEQGEAALQLYTQMQQEGIRPNIRTYVCALKACGSLATLEERNKLHGEDVKAVCLEHVRAIHSAMLESGYESDVFGGNMLVDVYAKCGSLVDAKLVFEKMPLRNVVTWTAMILGYAQIDESTEALHLYGRMEQAGVVPNDRTFVAALKACSSLGASEKGNEGDWIQLKQWCLKQVKVIHSHVMRSGCESDVFVGTMLVDAYAKCGSLVDARHVFEKMPHRNSVSWTAMILGYVEMEDGEEALQLYARMQQAGVVPDARVYFGALKACKSLTNKGDGILVIGRCLEQVRAIHADLLKGGFQSDEFLATILVDLYAVCGNLPDARQVFANMPHRNVVSWTAMIIGHAQMEQGEVALQLYTQMQQEGVVPNHRTFVAALKACGSVAGLEKGKQIHALISKTGLEITDPFVANSLIDMYCKCGSMGDAQHVFDAALKRNTVTWGALIAGYARQGESEIVFDLFQRMRWEGLEPDGITFLSLLTVCSHVGLVRQGQQYFEAMSRDYGITPNMEHYNCMVDLLGRAGLVEEAIQMVKTMPFQPSSKVWMCVLGACQKWRKLELERVAFEYIGGEVGEQ